MTRPLGGGVPSPVPPVSRSQRHFTPAAAATEGTQGSSKILLEREEKLPDQANQTITGFFKPVLNKDLRYRDRTALCSPDRGNVKDVGLKLPVSCTEHLKRKIPSPKVKLKKMPDQTVDKSPILEAFWREMKEEKDDVNTLENGRAGKGNGCHLKRRPLCYSEDTASGTSSADHVRLIKQSGFPDDPSQPKPNQLSNHQASAPNALRMSPKGKSQTVPSHHLRLGVSSGLSEQTDFLRKRKHTAINVDAGSSDPSELSSLDDPGFSSGSSSQGKNRLHFVKNFLFFSPGGEVLQLTEPAVLPRCDSTLSEEYLNLSAENERKNCSSQGFKSSYPAHDCAEKNNVSVVDTKENQLQVANSLIFLEKSLHFSKEKSTVLPSLHHLAQTKNVDSSFGNAGLSQVLYAKKGRDERRPERHARKEGYSVQSSNSFSKTQGKISKNASDSHSAEGSGEPVFSEEIGKSIPCSLSCKEMYTSRDHLYSQPSGELQGESTCTNESKLNGKSKSSFDIEYESLESSLLDDAEGEDEVFPPLQEITSSSHNPQARILEEFSSLDSFSWDTLTPPLLKVHLSKPSVVSQVSYVNSLEHLLKEKEESKRVDELEKLLQEDLKEREMDSAEEEDENVSGDEDLSEEHRAFINRFSVIAYTIPDYHPGEDIFDLSASGEVFNQQNFDLRNFHFIPQNPIEKLLLNSDVTQQLSVAINGFLSATYSCNFCPVPILKWLFQMMSVHPDYCVSTQILNTLMEITLKNASISGEQSKPWIPSLADVSAVFVNMGVAFRSLFPLQHLQPSFNEREILRQVQETMSKQQLRGDQTSASPAFSSLPDNNLINVVKFLDFCTTVIQGGYTDQELLLLLLMLFKISLEKQLKQIPLIDFQCLFMRLLINVKDWDAKMPELCLALNELSGHHHNLLWLVQLVPSWIKRGREVKRRLSLLIISKLLEHNCTEIPDDCDKQMSLLCTFLVYMKPSALLMKMRGLEQQSDNSEQLEQKVYYLIYTLLHLVSEASVFDVVNSNQRQHFLKLCGVLDKHIKCDIREDARLMYRTKVKDLVARIYGKWQDIIQTTWPTQGKLHDFWEPDC